MAEPITVGTGLAILGVGIPFATAIMKLTPNRNGKYVTQTLADIKDDMKTIRKDINSLWKYMNKGD